MIHVQNVLDDHFKMINMIVLHKSLRFIAILCEHPWNDSV